MFGAQWVICPVTESHRYAGGIQWRYAGVEAEHLNIAPRSG
jgi:hypothetical protein